MNGAPGMAALKLAWDNRLPEGWDSDLPTWTRHEADLDAQSLRRGDQRLRAAGRPSSVARPISTLDEHGT